MLKYFAIVSFLLIGSGAALADAARDCETLRGDAAIRACNQAIDQHPRDTASYNNRGNAYKAKGDLDRALADYTMAIEINPKYDWAYNGRGGAYWDKGDFDRAFADFTNAIEINPKNAAAYSNRGNVYQVKGDFGRAIADYTNAIEFDPKQLNAYVNRGALRALTNRDLPLALSDCDSAIRLDSSGAGPIGARGLVYLRLNRLDEAIAGRR
jgi:tetratricopeptide (TPR) repeat protein